MTRDRPASGAQDSTLEGEFPSDLGSNGGGGGGEHVERAAGSDAGGIVRDGDDDV